jgi:hypothetical protein
MHEIDFQFTYGEVTQRLSELTKQEVNQINKIAEAIQEERIFDCSVKAILAAFQLWLESRVQLEELDALRTTKH